MHDNSVNKHSYIIFKKSDWTWIKAGDVSTDIWNTLYNNFCIILQIHVSLDIFNARCMWYVCMPYVHVNPCHTPSNIRKFYRNLSSAVNKNWMSIYAHHKDSKNKKNEIPCIISWDMIIVKIE